MFTSSVFKDTLVVRSILQKYKCRDFSSIGIIYYLYTTIYNIYHYLKPCIHANTYIITRRGVYTEKIL